jgi:zinc finger protein 830
MDIQGHRVNVQRWEKEQAAIVEKAVGSGGKRKRDDEDDAGAKRPREEEEGALPADFFADPSMAPSKPESVELEEEAPAPIEAEQADGTVDDPEWAAFEASLSAGPTAPPPTASTANATIFAAPVMYEFGAPKVAEEGEEEEEGEGEEDEETEEEKAARKEREEREEIMERIDEEEREQMEADEKVAVSCSSCAGGGVGADFVCRSFLGSQVLKRRLEALREARKKKRA